MQVIFTQDTGSAKKDDMKKVKPGYLRYLLRYGKALPATEKLISQAEVRRAERIKALQASQAEAKELADSLKDLVVEFTEKADGEHLYGSVSEQSIADKLKEMNKLELKKDQVKMKEHIKTTGEHTVTLHLMEGVDVKVKVSVTAEESD
ncbi:50S ribosomal protein L9 [Candidatus Peregrinibacteria bacterium]|jgi:large subunit ribosomal protein L9|nr:50S ribosomal protein L9 [Candidatus Peregrinibacteria bacterium]